MRGKTKLEQLSSNDITDFVKRVEIMKKDGMSVSLIARALGIHRNTVNDRLRRAKEQMSLADVVHDECTMKCDIPRT